MYRTPFGTDRLLPTLAYESRRPVLLSVVSLIMYFVRCAYRFPGRIYKRRVSGDRVSVTGYFVLYTFGQAYVAAAASVSRGS